MGNTSVCVFAVTAALLHMQMVILLFLFLSFTASAAQNEVKCTEGLKLGATLKFTECYEPLLPVKYCHHQYRDTLGYVARNMFDWKYPNKTIMDEVCTTRKNKKMTSCDYLEHLTRVCGAHYDGCHKTQEKREIMRMWIKQFIRGTHEVYWEFAFTDDNQEIINGKCNSALKEFFEDEEIPEILSLINSGPNTFREKERAAIENFTVLIPTKISNLTQNFGIMVDQDGNSLGESSSNSFPVYGRPSHWKYCMYKMKQNFIEYDDNLFPVFGNLFRCDGKCNTNNGDDQEWMSDSWNLEYYQLNNRDKPFYDKENIHHSDGYPGENPIYNRDNGIFECVWGIESRVSRDVGGNLDDMDMDKVKMGLCRPFKTLLENCTIPVDECIGNIAVKELVMSELLKMIIKKTDTAREATETLTTPGILGSFTYDDCVIFGGDIAGASSTAISWVFIMLPTIIFHNILYN